MSENNDRPRPPARRTAGRALGGAKKTPPPPPPPAAELTPEQFAAEQAAAKGGVVAAGAPRAQPTSSAAVFETSAQGLTETVVAVETGTEAERQVPSVVSAPQPGALGGQPTGPAEPVEQHTPSPTTSAASGTAPTAEVAIRPAVPPTAVGAAFPVRADGPGPHQAQDSRPQEAPSEGAPYAHGPGRPEDIPEAAAVLNQRIITRESLDSSVPAALRLKKRIKRFALDNELDHLPIGDIVSVALDEWLTARGF